jgi:hypothetical protein
LFDGAGSRMRFRYNAINNPVRSMVATPLASMDSPSRPLLPLAKLFVTAAPLMPVTSFPLMLMPPSSAEPVRPICVEFTRSAASVLPAARKAAAAIAAKFSANDRGGVPESVDPLTRRVAERDALLAISDSAAVAAPTAAPSEAALTAAAVAPDGSL